MEFLNCFTGFFCAIGHHLTIHAEAYGVEAVSVAIAAGKNIPPKLPANRTEIAGWLWTWFYETVQTVLPTPRGSTQNPSLPERPAPTK